MIRYRADLKKDSELKWAEANGFEVTTPGEILREHFGLKNNKDLGNLLLSDKISGYVSRNLINYFSTTMLCKGEEEKKQLKELCVNIAEFFIYMTKNNIKSVKTIQYVKSSKGISEKIENSEISTLVYRINYIKVVDGVIIYDYNNEALPQIKSLDYWKDEFVFKREIDKFIYGK